MLENYSQNLTSINPTFLLVNLIIGTTYALILSIFVKKYSSLVGDKSQLMLIFPILIPVMILIVSVIKSSLALSLGLVGALSIVRFRTPIKDAEELIYIFIAIAMGLGIGAEQIVATSISFFFILLVIFVLKKVRLRESSSGAFLTIDVPANSESFPTLKSELINVVSSKMKIFELRKVDFIAGNCTLVFYIQNEKEAQPVIDIISSKYPMSHLSFTTQGHLI